MRRPLIGVLLAAAMLTAGCSGTTSGTPGASPSPAIGNTSSATATSGPAASGSPGTVTETPTGAWRISRHDSPFGVPWRQRPAPAIAGYANPASVAPGDPISLFVSTQAADWHVTAYRMGWYGGHEGAEVWHSDSLPGTAQPAATTTGSTRTPAASWRSSLTVATTGWRPGTYLFKLDAAAGSSYVPLTVRSPSTAGRLVLLTPDTTWQAYNDWGGRNLYWGPSGKGDYADRARAVTFDRPYAEGLGAGEYLARTLPVVALAERLGLPVAYADDVDLQAEPHLLDGAAGVVSMGHDEYWSVPMRQAITAARDAGTNLAWLGANAVFRRIRLAPTATGPHRLEINYKDAAEDPDSTTDPAQSTADWPSAPHPDPEATVTGEAYACFPGSADLVVSDPSSWLLAGTGLQRGDRLHGALGPEFDAVDVSGPMPRPLDVVLHSPVHCGRWRYSDATYYVAKSGAGVVDVGTMDWVKTLAGHHGSRSGQLVTEITTNVLRAFATPRAGRAHPATGTAGQDYPSLS